MLLERALREGLYEGGGAAIGCSMGALHCTADLEYFLEALWCSEDRLPGQGGWAHRGVLDEWRHDVAGEEDLPIGAVLAVLARERYVYSFPLASWKLRGEGG